MGARWGALLALLVLLGSALLPASVAPGAPAILSPLDRSALPPSEPLSGPGPALLAPPVSLPSDAPFRTNVLVSDDPGFGEQNEVSMAVDFQGRIAAAWNDKHSTDTGYKCGYSTSIDGGATWLPSQRWLPAGWPEAGDPVLAVDAVGRLYLTCIGFDRGPPDGSLFVMSSTDGGQTWSAPVDIGLAGGLDDKPWITAYGDGIVHAVWTYFGAGWYIVSRTSLDAGLTWSPAQQLSGDGGHAAYVDTDRYGRVHVTYREPTVPTISEPTDVWYRRSSDFGQTFSPPVFVSLGGYDCGCPARSSVMPQITSGTTGQDLYVVWSGFRLPTFDIMNANENIHLAYSHDAGASWTTVQVNVDNSTFPEPHRQTWPSVDVDHDGVVHVMWTDHNAFQLNTSLEVHYANSTDGGVTWTSERRVSDASAPVVAFMGDYQTVLADDRGTVRLAWCDSRNSHDGGATWDGDIYYSDSALSTPGPHFLDINPKNATITAGQTVQYIATVTDPFGNVPADTIEWVVSGGSIDASGLFTGGVPGTFRVRFYAGFRWAETNVTVTLGPLFRIEVTPPTATIPAGGSQQFTAAGYDAGGNSLPINPVWATDGGNVDGTGLYTHTVAATWTVFANDSGVSGNATVTVTPLSPVSLEVTPPTAMITADETQQFTATGYDVYGNPTAMNPTWTAGNGSIDASGLFTPWSVGTWDITATDGLMSDTATVTVLPGVLARIEVDPPTATITADDTQPYSATGYDAKGNFIPIAPVWSVDGGSIDATGLYTPTPTGTFTVTATDGGISGTAQVTVTFGLLVSIVISPPTAAITADETQQYNATGYDAKGNVVPINPAWSTDGGSVDGSGLYTPTPTGTFMVTATESGIFGTAEVVVTAGALIILIVTPATATITADETQQYAATGFDAKGNAVTLAPAWTASMGTVNPAGLYTPSLVGVWTITATDGALSGNATVTVTAGGLVSIVVTPPTANITADQTQQYAATGFDAKGNIVPIAPTWSVDGGSIDASGLYTPTPAGTFTVTATDGASSGTAQVTVTAGVLVSLVISPGAVTLTADETQAFTVVGLDAKGNPIVVAPGWSVDGGGSISASGTFDASTVGSWIVTATAGGLSATAAVTVVPGAPASILVDPETAEVLIGGNRTFVATVRDADGNLVPTAVIAWSLDGPGTIEENGLFTATAGGNGTVTATVVGASLGDTAAVTVPVPPPSSQAGVFPWWILLLVVLAFLLLLFLLWRRRRKEADGAPPVTNPTSLDGSGSEAGPKTGGALPEAIEDSSNKV